MAPESSNTMLAIALSKHCDPSEYDVANLPRPQITKPNEILIKVHAASVNPIDVKLAGSVGKLFKNDEFPYKVGYDVSGVVEAVGSSVTTFKAGDAVYSSVPKSYRGTIAEYCLSTLECTALKPSSLSFTEAAAIPLAAMTALQSLDTAERKLPGGLKGKTVFVPAGLSGTGHFAVQLAKGAFGAGKVVTTLSTGKVGKVGELLGRGSPDQVVDYTKEDVTTAIGKQSVDFLFDTAGQTISSVPLMKKGGLIVSISTVPHGTTFKNKNANGIPWWLVIMMNFADWCLRNYTGWRGINYEYLIMNPNAKDLERLANWVDEGKVKPVVGRTAKLRDIEDVRAGCQQILDGKGGIGKFVIEIV